MCEYSASAVLGNLVQWSAGSVRRDNLTVLEQHNKMAVMVDGDGFVTTLPLAYVSFWFMRAFCLANDHAFRNEEP